MSDIDTAVVVDSLKVLDPEWPIREADTADAHSKRRFRPNSDLMFVNSGRTKRPLRDLGGERLAGG